MCERLVPAVAREDDARVRVRGARGVRDARGVARQVAARGARGAVAVPAPREHLVREDAQRRVPPRARDRVRADVRRVLDVEPRRRARGELVEHRAAVAPQAVHDRPREHLEPRHGLRVLRHAHRRHRAALLQRAHALEHVQVVLHKLRQSQHPPPPVAPSPLGLRVRRSGCLLAGGGSVRWKHTAAAAAAAGVGALFPLSSARTLKRKKRAVGSEQKRGRGREASGLQSAFSALCRFVAFFLSSPNLALFDRLFLSFVGLRTHKQPSSNEDGGCTACGGRQLL